MKFQLTLLLVLFSISSFSKETLSSASAPNASVGDFSSLFFTIGYKNGSTNINHNETSAAAGFTSLNNTSSITNNSLDLGLMKEFFSNSSISFSVLAGAGLDTGKDKGKLDKTNLTFTDKLTGNHYSVGGSLNLNLEAYNIKIQPYIYSSFTNANSKYLLNYSKASSNANPTTIQYKNDIQQTDIGTGIRFIDPHVQLMSFLSVNYGANINKTTDSSSSNGEGNILLTSNSNVVLRPLTFSIGIGFFF